MEDSKDIENDRNRKGFARLAFDNLCKKTELNPYSDLTITSFEFPGSVINSNGHEDVRYIKYLACCQL